MIPVLSGVGGGMAIDQARLRAYLGCKGICLLDVRTNTLTGSIPLPSDLPLFCQLVPKSGWAAPLRSGRRHVRRH